MGTTVKILKKIKVRNGILITGLPGIGLVGKIAVDYILKQLDCEKVAEIYSSSFPPSVYTNNGIIELIKDEIYYYKFNDKDFFFLVGPVQPSLNLGNINQHYEFASKIVEFATKHNIQNIYTIAGINAGDKRIEEEPKVTVAVTDKEMLNEFKPFNIVKSGGLISGAAGLILGIAKQYNIKGACIMGETNHRLVYGDYGAAKKTIEVLIKLFGFKVDMGKIKFESKQIKQAFKQLSKQLEVKKEEKEPTADLSYVR